MTQHRIFFLISEEHFIPHGGIGSFWRGFRRMSEHFGWRVTVIMDKPPKEAALWMAHDSENVTIAWPENPLCYEDHNPSDSRWKKEIPNTFKIENFKTALHDALSANDPTHILINTPDAGRAVIELRLQEKYPTTFYTHHENLVINPVPKSSIFGAEYMGMLVNIVGTAGIQTATQSHYNVERMAHMSLSAPPIVLPMPIPDPELLEPYDGSREGVLFIGRHEPRKQPAVFARKVVQAELPAKVLTNKNGESKFRKTFEKHGVTDFEIRSQITGQEKADFIKSARIAFHPAKLESYGFSAMETLAAGLPTLLIHEYGWWQAFIDDGVHITPIRDAHNVLLELYECPLQAAPNYAAHREQQTFAIWERYLNAERRPG
ncbi:MAG: glycosyltransferase [Sulfitobacter sp.]